MKCTVCGGRTRVVDSEYPLDTMKKRRLECRRCKVRFNTYEEIDHESYRPPRVGVNVIDNTAFCGYNVEK